MGMARLSAQSDKNAGGDDNEIIAYYHPAQPRLDAMLKQRLH